MDKAFGKIIALRAAPTFSGIPGVNFSHAESAVLLLENTEIKIYSYGMADP